MDRDLRAFFDAPALSARIGHLPLLAPGETATGERHARYGQDAEGDPWLEVTGPGVTDDEVDALAAACDPLIEGFDLLPGQEGRIAALFLVRTRHRRGEDPARLELAFEVDPFA